MCVFPPEIVDLIIDFCDPPTQSLAAKVFPYKFKRPIQVTPDVIDQRLDGLLIPADVISIDCSETQLSRHRQRVAQLELYCTDIKDFVLFYDRIHSLHVFDGRVTQAQLQQMNLKLLFFKLLVCDNYDFSALKGLQSLSICNYGLAGAMSLVLPEGLRTLKLTSCEVESVTSPSRLHRVVFDDVDGGNELISGALSQVHSLQWTKYRPALVPEKVRKPWGVAPPRPWSSHDFPIDLILSRSSLLQTTEELTFCGLRYFDTWAKFPALKKLELLFPTLHPIPVLPKTIEALQITKARIPGSLLFVPDRVNHLVLLNCRMLGPLEVHHPQLTKLVINGCNVTTVVTLGPLLEQADLLFNNINEVHSMKQWHRLRKLKLNYNELARLVVDSPALESVDVSDNHMESVEFGDGVANLAVEVINRPYFRTA